MSVSYKKLWHILLDRNMKKKDLQEAAKLTGYAINRLSRDEPVTTDVGIFYADGDMLCKQYYRNERGNVHLISLNRERADADRFIHHKGDTDMAYYGRVILPRKPIVNLA